jgi:hypothetical protein
MRNLLTRVQDILRCKHPRAFFLDPKNTKWCPDCGRYALLDGGKAWVELFAFEELRRALEEADQVFALLGCLLDCTHPSAFTYEGSDDVSCPDCGATNRAVRGELVLPRIARLMAADTMQQTR